MRGEKEEERGEVLSFSSVREMVWRCNGTHIMVPLVAEDEAGAADETVGKIQAALEELADPCGGRPGHDPDPDPGRAADVSLLAWLRDERGIPEHYLPLAEAMYANDWCTSLAKCGMHESILSERSWTNGCVDYIPLSGSFNGLLNELRHGLVVHTEWQAKTVRGPESGTGPDMAAAVEGAAGAAAEASESASDTRVTVTSTDGRSIVEA